MFFCSCVGLNNFGERGTSETRVVVRVRYGAQLSNQHGMSAMATKNMTATKPERFQRRARHKGRLTPIKQLRQQPFWGLGARVATTEAHKKPTVAKTKKTGLDGSSDQQPDDC